ncbi:MAG: hypothetical protein EKK42_15620 [Pseudonocardiaceae bacterium]|nr:MAG: hypothetical protein EKK42_15620 [Pseudonocardiaceae bacterium]
MTYPIGARLVNIEHNEPTHPLTTTDDHYGNQKAVDVADFSRNTSATQSLPNRYSKNPNYGTVYYLTRDNGRLVIREAGPDGTVRAVRAPATGSSATLEMLMWASMSATTLTTLVPTNNPQYRNDGSNRVTFSYRKADAAFGFNTRQAVTALADDGWLTIADTDGTRWTVDLNDALSAETWATMFESDGEELTPADPTGSTLKSAFDAGPADV